MIISSSDLLSAVVVKEDFNSDGKTTYRELADGRWCRFEYNEKGQQSRWEDHAGIVVTWTYDAHGKSTKHTDMSKFLEDIKFMFCS